MKQKTLGLALGSGGGRGVAHIGFLKALEEAGIKPNYITGTSMGAVVGAAYAAGLSADQIYEIFKKVKVVDLIEPTLKTGGLFASNRIENILKKHIGDKTFDELEIPYKCVAADLLSRKAVVLESGKVNKAVAASSAIPAFFKPIELNGQKLVDGGIVERVPAAQVKEMGADVVVAVDVLARDARQTKANLIVENLMQVIDIMDETITKLKYNQNKKIIDLWLEPEIGEASPYSLKDMAAVYEAGYKIGKENVDKIKKLLNVKN